MQKELRFLFSTILTMLFLLLIQLSVTEIYQTDAGTDGDNSEEKNDNDDEDFEDENSIQICCTWGENLEDGILTYNIDNDDTSKGQQDVVHDAVEQWDMKIELLELDEISSKKKSDISFEFSSNNDEPTEGEGIGGQTTTIFDRYGFIKNAKISINEVVQGYEFDAATIGEIAKHEMGHALGLGHANFDGNLMAAKINDGTETVQTVRLML
jgi:predicted Zn-dependent protease